MRSGITLAEFTPLKQGTKSDLIYMHGTWLHSVSSKWFTYNLFRLNDFYVEVVIDNNVKAVLEVIELRGEEQLEKYLSTITLESLFSNQ